MPYEEPRIEASREGPDRSEDTGFPWSQTECDPEFLARKSLYTAFFEISTKNRKRTKEIEKLKYLIIELRKIQPIDLFELADNLGQSENTVRKSLKKLIKLDLVVRTRFEQHTLYCINGEFNQLVHEICSAQNL